jgi:hypothetical protein
MNDFDQVLDNSLQQIASGAATIDECLAQNPEHSAQLKTLLQTADLVGRGRELAPTEAYKSRARGQLMDYMQDHPHRSKRKFPPVWSVAISLAVLAIAFFVTGTALAQGALPGQPLYGWKLSSEQFWRASAPDRVGVDLQLADRRTSELTSVSANSAGAAAALAGYEQVLTQLKSESDVKNKDRIQLTLKSNQQKLSTIGIHIPALENQLTH